MVVVAPSIPVSPQGGIYLDKEMNKVASSPLRESDDNIDRVLEAFQSQLVDQHTFEPNEFLFIVATY